MAIKIDKDMCIGCGACAAECPEGIEMNDEGKAHVKNQEEADKCSSVVDVCPVGAISDE